MQRNQISSRQVWWHKSLALLAGGLISSGMLLLLLSEFHEDITERWLVGLDQATMAVVHSWMTPRVTQVMFGFTRIGSWQFMLPFVTLLVLFLLLKRHGREAAILAIAVGGSAVLNIGLKFWFHPSARW